MENNLNRHLVVDGHEFDDSESAYAGDGQFPPFVIFDVDAQANLPGQWARREAAQFVVDMIEKAAGPTTATYDGFCGSVVRHFPSRSEARTWAAKIGKSAEVKFTTTVPSIKKEITMIDFTKPVRCIDGTPARIICTDRVDPVHPIVALVGHDLPIGEGVMCFDVKGYGGYQGNGQHQLENIPDETVTYCNLHTSSTDIDLKGWEHPTREAALKAQLRSEALRTKKFEACLKITRVNGEIISTELVK